MKRAQRRFVGLAILAAALLLVSGFVYGAGRGASAHSDEAHPAHIHNGTCTALGDVVYPLNDVTGQGEMASPEAGMTMVSTPMAGTTASPMAGAENAATSTTTVKAALSDLTSGTYAINVHESKDQIQNYIACGEITGTPSNGQLQIELKELNNSGYSGTAWLKDNGDGTTTVTIQLTEAEGGAAMGTPASDTGTSTGAVRVEIKGFAFNPGTLEIPVGTTVTWTNDDQTAHTVSQTGGNGFESGKLDPGATFSYTFTTAGSYDYFCQFHANMKGTIVVK